MTVIPWSRLDIAKHQLDRALEQIADLENEIADLTAERDYLESRVYDLEQERQ